MKTRVLITVDTEPSIAGAFDDPEVNVPLIDGPVSGEVCGRSEALGFLMRTLAGHGLSATFFVETAHVSYFPPDIMGGYARHLAAADQDVQLHLHPAWLTFRDGRPALADKVSDQCSEIEETRLVGLIEQGADLIESWTGRRPTSMRTGNFAVSRGVFRAMKRAGLTHGSSICIGVNPPLEPDLRQAGGVMRVEGITELPVTCFSDVGPIGRGRMRPLQVTACSINEITAVLDEIHDAGRSVAVIVTHPFEFIKKSDMRYSRLRRNRLVQSRFEQLCAFLARNGDRFDVTTFDALSRHPVALEPAAAVSGRAARSVIRATQNFVNDRILV